MQARGRIAARAKGVRPGLVAEARGLERRRGLISFLTWAFVLAEVLGRDALGASSGDAAEADEPSPTRESGEAMHQSSDVADTPSASPDENGNGEPSTIISPGATLVLPAAANAVGPLNAGAEGWNNAGGDSAQPAAHGASGAASPVAESTIGSGESSPVAEADAVSQEAPSLVQLSISTGGLLHGVAETVEALPIGGDVLGATVESALSAVDALVGSVGGFLIPGNADGALASGGLIDIDAAPSPAPFDALHTPQGFTDYGIAIELDLSHGTTSAPLSSASGGALADLVKLGPDLLTAPELPALSDEAGQRSSADVLA